MYIYIYSVRRVKFAFKNGFTPSRARLLPYDDIALTTCAFYLLACK